MFFFYAVLTFFLLNIAVAFNISVPSTLITGQPTEFNWTWNEGDEKPLGYVLCYAGPGAEIPGCDIASRPRSIRDLVLGKGKFNVTVPSIGMYFVSIFTFTLTHGSDPENDDFREDDMFPIFESPNFAAVGPNGEGNATSVSIAPSDPPTSTVPSSTVSSSFGTSSTAMGTPTSGAGSAGTDSKKTRIIGGVAGGVSALFMAFCVLLCVTLIRRRRAKESLLSPIYAPTHSSFGTRTFLSRGPLEPHPYNYGPQYSQSPVDDGSPQSLGSDRPEPRIIPPAKLAEMPGSYEHGSPPLQENISPPEVSPIRSHRSLPVAPREDSEVIVRHEDSGWRQLPLPPPSRRVVEIPPSYVSD
ncbi:hypothetical protein Moror_7946 [Moniliophthora roreri MCA 2997]|uniref:Uncharacterized protein n=2 Tax=Moniliophthora roreri TaxID=221103 RepID=V2YE67_MONRO|nr:hypothetical protein Moror_7946 [Moniliophthora roreri MCA 2997]KAI3604418.1 hypothetical protein WG66_008284 [Moniliophthora roreri]